MRFFEELQQGGTLGRVMFETNVVNQKRKTVLIYYDKLLIRRRE